jgi:hypothetical protein
VVLFVSTTDARDMAREAGLDVKMLLGYKAACDVAGGVFDPENVDEADDRELRYIEGVPAGQWFETWVEDKGIAVSSAHSKAIAPRSSFLSRNRSRNRTVVLDPLMTRLVMIILATPLVRCRGSLR